MSAAFVIPSIFTAVDKFSPTVQKMGNNIDSFAGKAEIAISKAERGFRRLTPVLSHAAKDILQAFGAVAIAQKLVQGIEFSVEAIAKYDESLVNLKLAVGKTGKEFDIYKDKVVEVAKETKKSAIDVANVFSIIAKSNPELRDNAELLSKVADASIILAEASGMDLEPASNALTTTMRRFGIEASKAMEVSDAFAGTISVSKYKIDETALALEDFANTAKSFGLNINQSMALTAMGSSFSDAASEGGKLQKILTIMQAAKGLPKHVQQELKHFGISVKMLADPTVDIGKKFQALSTIQGKSVLMLDLFGKRNVDFAKGLLSNANAYDTIISKINEKNSAEKAAAEKENTLDEAITRVKNAWINMIVTSDKSSSALNKVKIAVQFVADHLNTIVDIGIKVLLFFTAWKAIMLLSRIAIIGLRGVSALFFLVDMVRYIALTQGLTFAQAAWAIVTSSCTGAMAALNAMMLANPIGLIIIGIAALIALIIVIINKWNEWGAAVSLFLGPIGLVISMIQSFRRNWAMIEESFKTGGILAGFKAIGVTIFDAILMPLQQVMKIIGNVTGFQWAKTAEKGLDKFRANMGVTTTEDENGHHLLNPKEAEQKALVQKMEQVNHAKVDINVKDPTGRTSASSDNNFVKINTGSTWSESWANQ